MSIRNSTLFNISTLFFILLELTLNAQPVTSITRPENTGVEKFDIFKNKAFNYYEFSLQIKNKAIQNKELSISEIAQIHQYKIDIDSLIVISEGWLNNKQKLDELKSYKGVNQNIQLAVDVLYRSKSNLRIAIALISDIDDTDE